MGKKLVAYFSATGKTEKAAKKLAALLGTEAYAIRPVEPYTKADLNWMNKNSRSTLEMRDGSCRPAIERGKAVPGDFETLYLGFPIWWYTAPRVINSFLETLDLRGRTLVLFATSGGSGFGETARELAVSAPGARVVEGPVFHGLVSEKKLREAAELG